MGKLRDSIKQSAQDSIDNPSNLGTHLAQDKNAEGFATDSLLKIKQVLSQELTTDPLNLGYAGKTNAEIVTLLNSVVFDVKATTEFQSARLGAIVQEAIREHQGLEDFFSIDKDGKISIENPEVQATINSKIQSELTQKEYEGLSLKDAMDKMKQGRMIAKAEKTPKGSRWSMLSIGIPYLPNELNEEFLEELLNG